MADGKNIEIKIAATGGDQAAADIRKVEKAADNLSGSGSGQGLKALNTEANKVTKSGVQMGTGFSNVGFQLQDFAVQVGAGTGALRAFSQQAPQLLSGFGPLGIALGTVAAVGAPLVGVMLDQAKATEGVTAASEDATKATIGLAREQAQSLRIEQESLTRKRELAETLREITSEQYSYNNSLQEQLDILAETQAAENELAAARGQLEVDKAEGDPVKQEQVRNRVRKEAQDRELKQIEERRRAASELVDRKTNQEVEVGSRGEGRAAQLRQEAGTVGARALQAEQLATLKTGTADDKAEASAKLKGPRKSIADREVAKLREEAIQATNEAKSLRAQESDLKGQAEAVETATKAEVEKLQVEANKLFDEVRKLAREAEKKQQLFGIRDEQGDLREGRTRATAKEQADRQAAAEDKKRKSAQLEGAAKAGRDAVALLPDGTRKEFADSVKAVSKRLQNGDQGGELAELAGLMRDLAASTITKTSNISGEVAELKKSIGILQQQIKNK